MQLALLLATPSLAQTTSGVRIGGVSVPAAVTYMGQYGRVTLVAASRGTLRAAEGLKAGARPAKLVLAAGMLSNQSGGDDGNVEDIIGTPDALPPTLVIHHRGDA